MINHDLVPRAENIVITELHEQQTSSEIFSQINHKLKLKLRLSAVTVSVVLVVMLFIQNLVENTVMY